MKQGQWDNRGILNVACSGYVGDITPIMENHMEKMEIVTETVACIKELHNLPLVSREWRTDTENVNCHILEIYVNPKP